MGILTKEQIMRDCRTAMREGEPFLLVKAHLSAKREGGACDEVAFFLEFALDEKESRSVEVGESEYRQAVLNYEYYLVMIPNKAGEFQRVAGFYSVDLVEFAEDVAALYRDAQSLTKERVPVEQIDARFARKEKLWTLAQTQFVFLLISLLLCFFVYTDTIAGEVYGLARMLLGVLPVCVMLGTYAYRLHPAAERTLRKRSRSGKSCLTESLLIGTLLARGHGILLVDILLALGGALVVNHLLVSYAVTSIWWGIAVLAAGLLWGGLLLVKGIRRIKCKDYYFRRSTCLDVQHELLSDGKVWFYHAGFENSKDRWSCSADMKIGDQYYLFRDKNGGSAKLYSCDDWTMDSVAFSEKPYAFIWKNLAVFAASAVTASALCLLSCSIAMWL